MNSWDLAVSNLSSVGVLAFAFGFLAARVKSDVRVPEQIYQFLSIYLLFGIGLKGGHSLRSVTLEEVLAPALTTVIAGALIPVFAYLSLRLIKTLSVVDRGSIAAHYGSTSLVTFSAALLFLESNSIFVEGFAPALLTLMEIPGLIVGIYLGSRTPGSEVKWSETLKEVLLGKTIECLAHSISYARIGIMLLVHAALLLTVNQAFESLGGLSSPMAMVLIIGGQIGIMMIEGLIVYIQSLRLHLYEFFTKWYDGGSQPFKQLVPETVYNSYSWKSKKK